MSAEHALGELRHVADGVRPGQSRLHEALAGSLRHDHDGAARLARAHVTGPGCTGTVARSQAVLHDAGEDVPGGADGPFPGAADLRDADPRMVADRDLQSLDNRARATGHQLDGPPVGHLAELERPEHLGARGPERAEIGQRDAIQPADQRSLRGGCRTRRAGASRRVRAHPRAAIRGRCRRCPRGSDRADVPAREAGHCSPRRGTRRRPGAFAAARPVRQARPYPRRGSTITRAPRAAAISRVPSFEPGIDDQHLARRGTGECRRGRARSSPPRRRWG